MMGDLIADLMHKCKGPFMDVRMFSQEKGSVAEKFTIDQGRAIDNCYSAFKDYVLAPFAADFRN